MAEQIDDILAHYGVKGMRWGQRKARKSRAKSKAKESDTEKTKYQKAPSRLSDAELSRRIKRLDMEKRYNELNAVPKSEGKQMATRILKNVGEGTATKVLNQVAYYGVKKAVEKKVGADVSKQIFGQSLKPEKKDDDD